ncbi:hypothetical protein CEUSTIGMA_g647.t1 [Chlamydomonas eustigma]|uniref:PAS domain-containing protein n=1 Tax=Chlamydomonas eustigma TaxID=1157962 RepID=A0A250WQR3_9CHLO|nr:hypothetical protein CEUSTIGMA_g647.t1 [Chlamydomonas eustigma]|eukprot:GAX73194.1 hypothetical protein CEUSTIGMA_g647.t1 [Chlamydomonas eustigma]
MGDTLAHQGENVPNSLRPGQQESNAPSGFIKALFGALYTLAKEKFSDSAKVAILNVVVDFALIVVIFLHLEYPWAVNPTSGWYSFFFWLEIQRPLAAKGWSFYEIIFYLLTGMLYLSVATCVWVAWSFKNDSFPFLWPIKFVRVVVSVFVGTLYIASINIFLTVAQCVPPELEAEPGGNSTVTAASGAVLVHKIWGTDCLSMPMMVHIIIALISSLLFSSVALLVVMADHELQPLSVSLLAAPHSMTELKSIFLKTIITIVDNLLSPWPTVQAVIFAICTVLNIYWHLAELPYYTAWMNSLRCGLYAIHAWVSLCLVVLMFTVEAKKLDHAETTTGAVYWDFQNYDTAKLITNIMFYGMLPMFFLGGLAAFLRLSYFFKIGLRFRNLDPNQKSKKLYKFSSDTDVEVISRVLRVWDDDHIPDPDALALGETIIKAGIEQFPKSPYVRIVRANVLITCRQQMQSGWTELQIASKLEPNLSYRFSIFTWEQEHKQKAASASTGNSNATDLVSFVEFQKHYKNLVTYHKAALMASQTFWRLLLKEHISLVVLSTAFRKIESMEVMADQTYKTVLARYPNSVKLLRTYANFLETVKNDPWAASHYFELADRVEDEQENLANDAVVDDGKGGVIDTKGNAVITIDAKGEIQSANKAAYGLFGYNRGELEKKNVRMLMPQPFSSRHDTFLKNYAITGKAKILDSQREVLGLHKANHVFPIQITVTKTTGSGADSVFLGILKAVDQDHSVIRAWLLTNGTILCVDQNFIDYAGWESNDLLGKNFNFYATDPAVINDLIRRAASLKEDEMASGDLHVNTFIKHKYSEDVPVNLMATMGGTEDQRLLVITMKRLAEIVPLAVFNHKGVITYGNSELAQMIGYDVTALSGMNISQLMEQPYGYLHQRWLKDQQSVDTARKPTPSGCRAKQAFNLLSSFGTYVPVRMAIKEHEAGDPLQPVITYRVRFEKVNPEDKDDPRRLQLHINTKGLITFASSSPARLFQINPENLVGKRLSHLIDVFAVWDEEGDDCDDALQAMLAASKTRPGISWRVGLFPDSTKVTSATGLGVTRTASPCVVPKSSLHLSNKDMVDVRSAILQVAPLDSNASSASGVVTVVQLWRPDMLTGIIEIDANLKITKSDALAAAVLGQTTSSLYSMHLGRILDLPSGTTFNSLLSAKRLKGSDQGVRRNVGSLGHVGPSKKFEGRHGDGQQLSITFQGALKYGKLDADRLMAMIKCKSGNFGGDAEQIRMSLVSMLAGNDRNGKGNDSAKNIHSDNDLVTARDVVVSIGSSQRTDLDSAANLNKRVGKSTQGDEQAGTGDVLLTARDVELEGLLSNRDGGSASSSNVMPNEMSLSACTRSGSGSRVRCRLSDRELSSSRLQSPSPLQQHCRRSLAEAAQQQVLKEFEGGASHNSLGDPSLTHQGSSSMGGHSWQNVDHQDPEEVPVPHDAEFDIEEHQVVREDMSVSSHEENDEDGDSEGEATNVFELQRKETMEQLEPGEKKAMKKSIGICRHWLDSGYKQTSKAAEGHAGQNGLPSEKVLASEPPPGAQEAQEQHLERYMKKAQEHAKRNKKSSSGDVSELEEIPEAQKDEVDHVSHEITSSDLMRGKRLKRLLKQLSGRQAMSELYRLQLHMWIVLGAVVLLHVGCFAACMFVVHQQEVYVGAVSNAGESIIRAHSIMTYTMAIDAALRGYGFNASYDLPYLCSQLIENLDSLTGLQNSLYLGGGSGGVLAASVWNDASYSVLQYKDNAPLSQTTVAMSLWDLSSTFISSGRQVALTATHNTSSTLQQNQFWLFINDNGPEVLYHGYLHVLDLVVINAQGSIRKMDMLLIALLVVEAVMTALGATSYIWWLLKKVAKSRAALFTVFLFVPSGLLQALSKRKAEVGDGDSEDYGLEQDEDARSTLDDNVSMVDQPSRRGSLDLAGRASLDGQKTVAGATINRRRSLDLKSAPTGKTQEVVEKEPEAVFTVRRQRAASFSGAYKREISGEVDVEHGIFNGKRLVDIGKDVYPLVWPFLVCGLLILVSYIISITTLNNLTENLINIKLLQRSHAQAYRVAYYSSQLVLQDPSTQNASRTSVLSTLTTESSWLQVVYNTSLYGGPTLNDSLPDGSNDWDSGSLFASQVAASLLFKYTGCLRASVDLVGASGPACSDPNSTFHEVASHALDPMVQRLITESRLLGQGSLVEAEPDSLRWLFIWQVARVDLSDGLFMLATNYNQLALKTFIVFDAVQCAVMALIVTVSFVYAFFMFRPFVSATFAESKRVAELLSQLPNDMDVENMVEASYKVVLEHKLDSAALNMVPEARGLSLAAFSQIFQHVRRSITSVSLPEPVKGVTDPPVVNCDMKQHQPDEDQQEVVLMPVAPIRELAAAAMPRLSTSSQEGTVVPAAKDSFAVTSSLPALSEMQRNRSSRRSSLDIGIVGDYPAGFDFTALIMAQGEDGVWSPMPVDQAEKKRGWRDSAGSSNRIKPVHSSSLLQVSNSQRDLFSFNRVITPPSRLKQKNSGIHSQRQEQVAGWSRESSTPSQSSSSHNTFQEDRGKKPDKEAVTWPQLGSKQAPLTRSDRSFKEDLHRSVPLEGCMASTSQPLIALHLDSGRAITPVADMEEGQFDTVTPHTPQGESSSKTALGTMLAHGSSLYSTGLGDASALEPVPQVEQCTQDIGPRASLHNSSNEMSATEPMEPHVSSNQHMPDPLLRAVVSPSSAISKSLFLRPASGNRGSLDVAMQLHSMMMEGLPEEQADEESSVLEVPKLGSFDPDSIHDKCEATFVTPLQPGPEKLLTPQHEAQGSAEPLVYLPPSSRDGAITPIQPHPSKELSNIPMLPPPASREGALAASILKRGDTTRYSQETKALKAMTDKQLGSDKQAPQAVGESNTHGFEHNVQQALLGLFSDE